MNKFLIALMLFSANAFADLQYDLDKMQQDWRLNQVEQQMQDMQIKQQHENDFKFYDDLKNEINKTGWE